MEGTVITPARGFMAEHGHYHDDDGFWEAHADRLGGPVCDVGAAAGRITLRVAARGHDVWAVDTDPEMLEVLRERAAGAGIADRVHGVRGSMTGPLPVRGAGLVMIPMNSLQLMRSADDRRACFAAARDALRPGGEMIFDLAMPHFPVIGDLIGVLLDTGHSVDPDTRDLLMHQAVFERVNPACGEADMRIIIERIHADGTRTRVERPHHLHLYEPDEIPALASDAGLEVVCCRAGFRDEPLVPDAERHVWRLRRPDA